MSLNKQLWLAICLLMTIAFMGSFIVSSYSARSYLEEQLLRKNIDNASALAIAASSSASDKKSIQLFITAQFDTGHYQWIRLLDDESNVVFEKQSSETNTHVPGWFTKTFQIQSTPGTARLTNGRYQHGSISLASSTKFAHEELWATVKGLFFYFVIIAIAAGGLGTLLLRFITQPLARAVSIAEAIGEKRFITSEEPRTKEFKAVIRSMNKLSQHVKQMLQDETAKLERLRQSVQIDLVSGLLNREPVLNYLHSYLQSNDVNADGLIITIRIADLADLNKDEGRKNMDALLSRFGRTLTEVSIKHNGIAGRLNGSDFVIILPRMEETSIKGRGIFESLLRDCRDLDLPTDNLVGSSTAYHAGETVSRVLSRLDHSLISSHHHDARPFVHIYQDDKQGAQKDEINWSHLLQEALVKREFELELYPLMSAKGLLLHAEAPARLILSDGHLIQAGIFMPHINRLRLAEQLDLIVLELAFDQIARTGKPVGINLSASLLTNDQAMLEVVEIIKLHAHAATSLWMEIPEYGVFQHMEKFKIFCQLLSPYACKIGVEHLSKEFARIGELHDLGLDYIKIDRSLVHNIHEATAFQVFLRGMCTIVHSIGLQIFAEGIESEEEWRTLIDIGFDGGTGEFFPQTLLEKAA